MPSRDKHVFEWHFWTFIYLNIDVLTEQVVDQDLGQYSVKFIEAK